MVIVRFIQDFGLYEKKFNFLIKKIKGVRIKRVSGAFIINYVVLQESLQSDLIFLAATPFFFFHFTTPFCILFKENIDGEMD